MFGRSFLNFFQAFFIKLLGVGFIALSIFLFASFISHDLTDPSANHAGGDFIKNWGGYAGAYIANPIIQFLGLGSYIMPVIALAWGWNLLSQKHLSRLWLRITMFVLCVPLASTSFAALDRYIDVPVDWPSNTFGGFIGGFLRDNSIPFLTFWGYAAISTILTISTFILACGLPIEKWKAIGSFIVKTVSAINKGVLYILHGIRKIIAHFKNEEEEEEEKPAKKRKSIRKIIARNEEVESKVKKGNAQKSFDIEMRDKYQLPPLSLLKASVKKQKTTLSESGLSQNAELLEKVLDDFGINGKITEVSPGPVVTLYALEPSPGTKSSRVIGLADDIARSMTAVSARIAVIPGKNAIGIELPNSTRETVYLKELLGSENYKNSEASLPLALGKDISGNEVIIDLAKTPHLLVAGTTGSGKSVGINAMILSLLYKYSPDECKFIMVDPKMLELSVYQDIPHLLSPVVTEPGKAVVALKWVVKEMESRYRLMSNFSVRNIHGYNQRIKEAKKKGEKLTRTVQTGFDPDSGKPIIEEVPLDMNTLPLIVVIVDEMADLMLVAGKDIETSVQRLAQMARAAGIHIILATQRPSVDVITGVIKANFPTRISFQVTSKIDSRTILGEQGAEQLLGMGDMLYMAGGNRITRVHGPFVDDKEVEAVVSFLKKQGQPSYVDDITKDDEEAMFGEEEPSEKDELYNQAVTIVCRDGKASTSYIQRSLKIGYNRAANIMETMEKEGIVGAPNHVGKREILLK